MKESRAQQSDRRRTARSGRREMDPTSEGVGGTLSAIRLWDVPDGARCSILRYKGRVIVYISHGAEDLRRIEASTRKPKPEHRRTLGISSTRPVNRRGESDLAEVWVVKMDVVARSNSPCCELPRGHVARRARGVRLSTCDGLNLRAALMASRRCSALRAATSGRGRSHEDC